MKKIIATALVFTISCVNTYTQTHWGAKVGLNLSQIQNAEYFDDTKPRLGMNCGLLAQFKLNNKFFIQPEALYSGKGFKFTGWLPNSPVDWYPVTCVASLHYISVPVMAGFKAGEKFSFLLGPEASYLINATTSIEEEKPNTNRSYNRFDIAVDFGAVFNLNKRLAFDFRYSHGFRVLSGGPMTGTVSDDMIVDYFGIREGSNRTLQFDFVYLFNAN